MTSSNTLEKLELYISRLNHIIRTNESTSEILNDLLNSIHYFISLSSFSIKVSTSHNLKYENPLTSLCLLCNTFQYKIHTACGHDFCRACLKTFLLSSTNNTLISAACPECQQSISSNLLYRIFGSTKKVSEIKKAAGIIPEILYFHCEICLKKSIIESGITLDCDHRFCKICLKDYISEKINSNQLGENDFCCPKCPKEISPHIVQGNFPAEIFSKFLDFKMNFFSPDSQEFVYKTCPHCPARMEISVRIKEVQCKGCGAVYCPQCNILHSGRKCKDQESDERSEENTCPKCKEGVEKLEGCNFVKCPWPNCRNSYFCYLCGKELTRVQHYSHFTKSGPFGGTCNSLDGIPE